MISVPNRQLLKQHHMGIGLPVKSGRTIIVVLLSLMISAFFAVSVSAQESGGKDLRAFYQNNCARCHGPDGSAVSADGKKLHGQDFTDQDWRSKTSDDEMAKTIRNGKFFGLAMPKFKQMLTDDEIQRMITDIIRKSKKGQPIVPETE